MLFPLAYVPFIPYDAIVRMVVRELKMLGYWSRAYGNGGEFVLRAGKLPGVVTSHLLKVSEQQMQ